MWIIYEHSRAVRQLGSIPEDVLKRYEKWKDIVTASGIQGLGLIQVLHGEALRGE